jgi:hypothetical protein
VWVLAEVPALDRSHARRNAEYDVILVISSHVPIKGAPVYDELIREMDRLGWGAQDREIRSKPRLRP